jgi:hypothetical protein
MKNAFCFLKFPSFLFSSICHPSNGFAIRQGVSFRATLEGDRLTSAFQPRSDDVCFKEGGHVTLKSDDVCFKEG